MLDMVFQVCLGTLPRGLIKQLDRAADLGTQPSSAWHSPSSRPMSDQEPLTRRDGFVGARRCEGFVGARRHVGFVGAHRDGFSRSGT
ncbi:hypothetical protein VP01_1442g5 [Puccinia sorghi]|uniref:Uncharacterized protein n=1 Tax=Puccinia sorghi TaxID=27349 RepID=A0A0L6VKR1_9BASI|nr:hypothetical protein VP01_1442g5 [Puccinia sorghi]